MAAPGGFGLILMLIFVGLLMGVVYLALRRESKRIPGNRLLIGGVIITLVIVFLVIRGPLVSYYKSMFKEAPYDFSQLKSIVFKFGVKDSLVNQYNSATGEYQYQDRRDSLIKMHLDLTRNDLIYLHRKAIEIGFWDFPANEVTNDTTDSNSAKPLEYLFEFNYQNGGKRVLFSDNYDGDRKLVEANLLLISEFQTVLRGAEERQKTFNHK
jgi:hypothetical protein